MIKDTPLSHLDMKNQYFDAVQILVREVENLEHLPQTMEDTDAAYARFDQIAEQLFDKSGQTQFSSDLIRTLIFDGQLAPGRIPDGKYRAENALPINTIKSIIKAVYEFFAMARKINDRENLEKVSELEANKYAHEFGKKLVKVVEKQLVRNITC